MAVQFADKALDGWLTRKIQECIKERPKDLGDHRYISALEDVQKQLHVFWGSALKGD